MAEVYPSLWSPDVPREARTPDQHDAYVVAETLRRADEDGRLRSWFSPGLEPAEQGVASLEGWILGVP